MRHTLSLNAGWFFLKDTAEIPVQIPECAEPVTIPHCWNAIDGQDGGADYFRGSCIYLKTLSKSELPAGRCFLEINGANSSADVHLNGKHLTHHDGGYSTFRVELTEHLTDNSLLSVTVDNSPNETVYPQMADFTFYGGLYRNVNLIIVPESHFDLTHHGGPGIQVIPSTDGTSANVDVALRVTGLAGHSIRVTLLDHNGEQVAESSGTGEKYTLHIPSVHLWNGRKDPYLYSAKAELLQGDEVIDCVSTSFGVRSYAIDPRRGFLLNGEPYPLRGVSRHQDRKGLGNALLPEHHEEDIRFIHELGATTIRLAHYQHDQYFYDLCDRYGQIVWAEIPYISRHMPTGRDNTVQQMKELICQNINHPSIVVWGLSNEITMNGASDPDLLENHRILNDLCHAMDPSRLTTMAVLSMCDPGEKYVHIPDVVSYNHYFGWYGGTTDMNGPWLDDFHERFPDKPIGVSEYGCEALNWHTSQPRQGDYTEEYQAHYHEELIRQLFTRPYLWATHVWNMFDFGADARAEGGENGQNHKGLMTFDRSYKKDAFYAYKAWLSDEPFVHICGKRYVDRAEDTTRVTVYSNQPVVELFANGSSVGKCRALDHFFYFDVPLAGDVKLEAVAGEYRDESFIRRVAEPNPDYVLKETGAVLNWFDIQEREGYFCLNDTIGDVMKTFRGKALLLGMTAFLVADMKRHQVGYKSGSESRSAPVKLNKNVLKMIESFTVLRASTMVGMVGAKVTKEQLLRVNALLNGIRKPK